MIQPTCTRTENSRTKPQIRQTPAGRVIATQNGHLFHVVGVLSSSSADCSGVATTARTARRRGNQIPHIVGVFVGDNNESKLMLCQLLLVPLDQAVHQLNLLQVLVVVVGRRKKASVISVLNGGFRSPYGTALLEGSYHMVHQGVWAGVEIVQHKDDRAGSLHGPHNLLFIVARRLLVVLHRAKLKHLQRHNEKEIQKNTSE